LLSSLAGWVGIGLGWMAGYWVHLGSFTFTHAAQSVDCVRNEFTIASLVTMTGTSIHLLQSQIIKVLGSDSSYCAVCIRGLWLDFNMHRSCASQLVKGSNRPRMVRHCSSLRTVMSCHSCVHLPPPGLRSQMLWSGAYRAWHRGSHSGSHEY